jgi:hypothetical protein
VYNGNEIALCPKRGDIAQNPAFHEVFLLYMFSNHSTSAAKLQQNKTENAENRGKRRNSRNTNIK